MERATTSVTSQIGTVAACDAHARVRSSPVAGRRGSQLSFSSSPPRCNRPRLLKRDGKKEKKTHWLTPSLPPCSAQQVGVSNDVMLASKGSAFMEMTIHGLVTFNHDYVSNYPTVMFTTG
jgi:hypothetical protein